ncbi:secretoglobin family 1D member 2-like [Tamandua tetradactyla]|uniref:secretoglobin family 1D member 2-like n=1 Tax=Tamandua tetradactyla TaxID=48850 RepID=UPI004053DF5E
MRLCSSLLLVTLAFFCCQANAAVCPSLLDESISFLFSPEMLYKMLLFTYRPPAEAVEAKVEVKKCVDQMPIDQKFLLADIVEKIQRNCTKSP